jgi:hypothetical protein
LPASSTVTISKGDKLPSAHAMADARGRIIDWWQQAYINAPLQQKFLLEAGAMKKPLKIALNACRGDRVHLKYTVYKHSI